MDDIKKIIEDSKRMYLTVHKNKTEEELDRIISYNHSFTTSSTATVDEMIAHAKRIGEADACLELKKEIWNQLEEGNEKILEKIEKDNIAKKEWEKNFPILVAETMETLAGFTSYEGQLIISLLETEGSKYEDEIISIVKEMVDLTDENISDCLDNLEKEGVLYCDSKGKYYLIDTFEDNLFPKSPISFAKTKCQMGGIEWQEKYGILVERLAAEGPLSRSEVYGVFYSNNYYKYERYTVKEDYSRLSAVIIKLKRAGIIAEIDNQGRYSGQSPYKVLYYFPILSKKQGGEN